MTEVIEISRLGIQMYFIAVFVKIAYAKCVQSKPYQVLTQVNSNLTGDYYIRGEDVLEMFKNQTWQS